MKVIKALETGLSYDGPAGKSTIDPATHHNITDVYIGVADNHKFNVVEKYDAAAAVGHRRSLRPQEESE